MRRRRRRRMRDGGEQMSRRRRIWRRAWVTKTRRRALMRSRKERV